MTQALEKPKQKKRRKLSPTTLDQIEVKSAAAVATATVFLKICISNFTARVKRKNTQFWHL